jgi:hypothetical protein
MRKTIFPHPAAQPRQHDRSSFEFHGYEIVFGHQTEGLRTIHAAWAEAESEMISVRETTFRACIAKIKARLATLPKGTFIDRNV